MKLKLSFFLFLFVYVFSFGQQLQLTEDAEVSVLTFGPGESLNDAFGHNAFRIKDKSKGIDLVSKNPLADIIISRSLQLILYIH